MNRRRIFYIGWLFVLILTACGGGDEAGKPVEVVKEVVAAMENLDVDAASEHFCEARRSELQDAMSTGFEELEALGLDPDELLDAFKLQLKDMKYEEKSTEDDKAVVGIQGSMALDFDSEKLKSFLKKAGEASGESMTDEQLDFAVGMFSAIAGQEAPIDGEVELIKEDGEWVVCDELDFLESSDLLNLP